MNMYLKLLFMVAAITLLSACGGDGNNWGDMNSSYSATLTVNGKEYTCKSQKAYEACSNSKNSDCSACTLNSPSNEIVITTSCPNQDNGKTYLVTSEGCIVPLVNNVQTAVCTTTNLRLLSGNNLTRTQLLNSGSSFSRSGLTVNGTLIKCI